MNVKDLTEALSGQDPEMEVWAASNCCGCWKQAEGTDAKDGKFTVVGGS